LNKPSDASSSVIFESPHAHVKAEAFWLLVVVMNEEPYKLREIFGEDMAGTHELYIAEKLLHIFYPLSKQLEIETMHVSMIVTPWLMTVYASTFPFKLVVRVWEVSSSRDQNTQ
jgi:hypothetical protein